MTKKEKFINFINEYLMCDLDTSVIDPDVVTYWEALQNGGSDKSNKSKFTDNGKLILTYLQNENSNTPMKSKDIADQIGISSRSVAGAMKKLVSDGWIEAVGDSPKLYIITENGKNIKIED